jgi:hypothetical protein
MTAAQAPPVPQQTAARPRGSRGLWLAIGALIGAGVLIAAGIYVPRHFGTHADPNKAMFPSKTDSFSATNSATGNSTPASTDSSSQSASTPVVSLQGAGESVKVDANGNVSLEGPAGGIHVDGTTGSVTMSGKGRTVAVKPNRKDLSSGNPIPSRSAAQQAAPPQVNAVLAPPPGPSAEEIEKAEDEADKLNIRAAAATHSVDTLRQQQQAAGYNLRADIAASEERMQLYLSKGNEALKAEDLKSAKKYFDLADAELAKLEKFLGH